MPGYSEETFEIQDWETAGCPRVPRTWCWITSDLLAIELTNFLCFLRDSFLETLSAVARLAVEKAYLMNFKEM